MASVPAFSQLLCGPFFLNYLAHSHVSVCVHTSHLVRPCRFFSLILPRNVAAVLEPDLVNILYRRIPLMYYRVDALDGGEIELSS
jgi:hypothetical protein